MSYRLVIFDWDGTLMDSTRLIASCLQCACRDLRIAVPEFADARFVIGMGLVETVRYVAPGLDEEGARQLVERYRHHFLSREHEVAPYEGIPEMLANLHGRGKRLAVATGKARRGLDRALDATGFRQWFEATRCADEGFAKPHPDMVLKLLQQTGVEAREALLVGDTTHDLELAANAGVDAVAVCYGAHERQLLKTRTSRACLSSVAQLNRWLTTNA